MTFPVTRLRRLRKTPALRDLMRETKLSADDFIYPIFIDEGISEPLAIEAMPGVCRHPEADIPKVMKEVVDAGVKAVILFGVSHHKDDCGSDTWNEDGLIARMTKAAKAAAPDVVVIIDVCFCEYTDHGHCGVIKGDSVDNDETLENLCKQAINAAKAGADMIAPSGMMDGMVIALRDALDDEGFEEVPIMSYAAKFASSFYGPFREAAGCSLKGDRKTYQMDPANGNEALLEAAIDEAEGADILMVKPGMPYLDVLKEIKQNTLLPMAVYQVSGEYAMIKFAAKAGALDEEKVMLESLLAFKRAGADLILTYFALDAARLLSKS